MSLLVSLDVVGSRQSPRLRDRRGSGVNADRRAKTWPAGSVGHAPHAELKFEQLHLWVRKRRYGLQDAALKTSPPLTAAAVGTVYWRSTITGYITADTLDLKRSA